MSYRVEIRVKIENKERYIAVSDYDANITYNVRELIYQSSDWKIKNCESNGLAIDWIKKIHKGIKELTENPEEYRQYEASNGWGTVEGTLRFYKDCVLMFEDFMLCYEDLVDVAVVWVH